MVFPQTLFRLILGCFLLTAIPLSFAIAHLAMNLNDVAARGQIAVKRAEAVGAITRDLRNAGVAVERVVRQGIVLEDESLSEDFRGTRQAFLTVVSRAEGLPINDTQREAIAKLRVQDVALNGLLSTGLPPPEQRGAVVDQAIRLSELSDAVVFELEGMVGRELSAIEAQASKGSLAWPFMVGVSAILAGVLGLGFAMVLSRPLRSLDQSIRRMGKAQFDTPVTIKGPQDLRSLGERLEWLRQRLSELESHQANFLRQVSHELKTPLTAIREGTELLNDRVGGELSEGQQELVKIIRENSVHLQKLITDLLTYQQHRSAVPLKLEPVSLPELISQVIESHRIPILAKALTTRVHITPITMPFDRERMRVVFDNLLSNAIKFSPKSGKIFVVSRVVGDQLQIDVTDQGPGVSVADKVRIFESFYQGQTRPDSNVKGTGLGLSIARDFVVSHGGEISVIDAGQNGGKFRITLPIPIGSVVDKTENLAGAV
jgi:two-component system, NtrC family, sensor histidine kinase GlrK